MQDRNVAKLQKVKYEIAKLEVARQEFCLAASCKIRTLLSRKFEDLNFSNLYVERSKDS